MSHRTSRTSRIVLTIAILVAGVFATPIDGASAAWDFFRVGHEGTASNWLLLIFFTTTWNLQRTAVERSHAPVKPLGLEPR